MVRKPVVRDRVGISMVLSREDFVRLETICREREQSRTDFLRAALSVAELVPNENYRPLTGICLERHEAKKRRESKGKRTGGRRKSD